MRFVDGRLTAVYDWDSLGVGLEPVLVGSISHAFTSNWGVVDWEHFPSLEEALSFIDEYEDARGSPFSADERAVAFASLTYTMAYTARCEHSDALTSIGVPPSVLRPPCAVPAGSARAFLVDNAKTLLGVDVGPTPDVLLPDRKTMMRKTETPPAMSRERLVEELAIVSHEAWILQGVRDYARDPSKLSTDVHDHDRERAELTVRRLEQLGVVNWTD
jgi:hypothetical protein